MGNPVLEKMFDNNGHIHVNDSGHGKKTIWGPKMFININLQSIGHLL